MIGLDRIRATGLPFFVVNKDMPKLIDLEEDETFRRADERWPDTTYVKKSLAEGVIGANAREVESGDTVYISPDTKVERTQ